MLRAFAHTRRLYNQFHASVRSSRWRPATRFSDGRRPPPQPSALPPPLPTPRLRGYVISAHRDCLLRTLRAQERAFVAAVAAAAAAVAAAAAATMATDGDGKQPATTHVLLAVRRRARASAQARASSSPRRAPLRTVVWRRLLSQPHTRALLAHTRSCTLVRARTRLALGRVRARARDALNSVSRRRAAAWSAPAVLDYTDSFPRCIRAAIIIRSLLRSPMAVGCCRLLASLRIEQLAVLIGARRLLVFVCTRAFVSFGPFDVALICAHSNCRR